MYETIYERRLHEAMGELGGRVLLAPDLARHSLAAEVVHYCLEGKTADSCSFGKLRNGDGLRCIVQSLKDANRLGNMWNHKTEGL